jgi:hypothetical protein
MHAGVVIAALAKPPDDSIPRLDTCVSGVHDLERDDRGVGVESSARELRRARPECRLLALFIIDIRDPNIYSH